MVTNFCVAMAISILMLMSINAVNFQAAAQDNGGLSSDTGDLVNSIEDVVATQDFEVPSSDSDSMAANSEVTVLQGINGGISINLPTRFLDILMGRYGRRHGVTSSGTVYTRWGRTTCPSTSGTTLLYTGLAGGTWYGHHGGGANYLCLPKKPQYLKNGIPSNSLYSFLYGSEYQNTLIGTHDHNVPCSVCHVSNRGAKVMIPAQTTCPKSWTEEYKGYLMAERFNHHRSAVYECVDRDAESLPGSARNVDGALFYHVVAACNKGDLPCPSYLKTKTITCVVCTK